MKGIRECAKGGSFGSSASCGKSHSATKDIIAIQNATIVGIDKLLKTLELESKIEVIATGSDPFSRPRKHLAEKQWQFRESGMTEYNGSLTTTKLVRESRKDS